MVYSRIPNTVWLPASCTYTPHSRRGGHQHPYPLKPARKLAPRVSSILPPLVDSPHPIGCRQLALQTRVAFCSPKGHTTPPCPESCAAGTGCPLRSTGFALHAVIPSSLATCKCASRSTGTPKTTVYTTNVILHTALRVPLHPLSATTTIFAPQGRPRMPRPSSRPPFPSC